MAWVGELESENQGQGPNEAWISCKELKDRRLHHVDDVEGRAHDLNLRIR